MPIKQRFNDVAHYGLDDDKERRRPQQHGPSRVDRRRKCQRKHGRDDSADIGHEAQNGGENAPQDGAGNSDDPQTDADHDTERSIHGELHQKQPAQAGCGVVERGGRLLQIMRARELDETIPQVLPLQQHEDDKNGDDACRGEGVDQRRKQCCNALQSGGGRLANLDRYGLRVGSRRNRRLQGERLKAPTTPLAC